MTTLGDRHTATDAWMTTLGHWNTAADAWRTTLGHWNTAADAWRTTLGHWNTAADAWIIIAIVVITHVAVTYYSVYELTSHQYLIRQHAPLNLLLRYTPLTKQGNTKSAKLILILLDTNRTLTCSPTLAYDKRTSNS